LHCNQLHPSEDPRILDGTDLHNFRTRGHCGHPAAQVEKAGTLVPAVSNGFIQGEVVGMRKAVRGAIAAFAGMAVFALSATSAFAADGYNGGDVAGQQTGGNLPFTGSELLLYVVVGVAIVACGFALRALSARHATR
jgi:hypothetical protein